MTAASVRRRYLVLLGLRWLPVGFTAPLLVLILTRELTLTQAGPLLAVYGVTTTVLELPTGGLADAVGRRPVLLASSVCSAGFFVSLLAFDSMVGLAAGMFVGGVARALDSGPLESWFVDRSRAIEPRIDLRPGLALGGTVDGATLAVGAILGGLLPELFDDRLLVSVWVALALQLVHLIAVHVLMEERRPPTGRVGAALSTVPATVRTGLGMATRHPSIRRLLIGALTIGVALVAVEALWQPRFVDLLDARSVSGGPDGTAFLGLLLAGAFAGGALGAASVARLAGPANRWPAVSASIIQVMSAVAIMALAIVTWTPGAAVLFVAFYVFMGAAAPLRDEMMHEQVTSELRSTMVSSESLVFQAGGFVAALAATRLADDAGIPAAWSIAAVILAVGGLFYLGVTHTSADR